MTGSKTTPIQRELMRTSIPECTLAEAVHIDFHILLVHIVAAVVDNIGLAAWVASECPNQVEETASLQASLYVFYRREHSIQRWRREEDLLLHNTLQSRYPCGRRSKSEFRLRCLCLCSVPV